MAGRSTSFRLNDDVKQRLIQRAEREGVSATALLERLIVAVLVCVLKRNLPAGDAQAAALADLLDRWARANPRPYIGQHRPV